MEQTATELREVYISHGHASGISPDTMLSLISTEQIALSAEHSILAAYGVGAPYNFERHADYLYNILHEYAMYLGLEDTPELEEGLRDLAVLCTETLQSRIDSPILAFLSGTVRFFTQAVIAAVIITAISASTVFLIFFTNRRVTRAIDGLLYALGTVLIICTAIPTFFYFTGLTGRLQIMPLSLNRFITSLLDGIIYGYFAALIPLLLCMAVCIFIRVFRWKKRMRAYH